MSRLLRVEVWELLPSRTIVVTTDRGDGGGTRIVGPKLRGPHRRLADFYLDEVDVEALAEDLAAVPDRDDATSPAKVPPPRRPKRG